MRELLQRALPGPALVVAIDPGKVQHRVWFSTADAGLKAGPMSVPFAAPGAVPSVLSSTNPCSNIPQANPACAGSTPYPDRAASQRPHLVITRNRVPVHHQHGRRGR
jgi:hypothetical protein